ncbi:MAG: tetratricopeptide repeat protein [Aureispira sp.]|nr:tetratricopeptide repeat protein [Aureispira sp.]
MKQLFIFLSSILLILIIADSCTPPKEGTKVSPLSKAYHNLTGRYNAYYHAGLQIDESFETVIKQHQDNYNKLLAMYPYATKEAQAPAEQLDEAIKKCSRNIELHRVSNWVDDSYFYIGQAEFLKKDFEKSAATFKYIADKYNPENIEKDKKAAEKNSRLKKKKKKRRKRKKKKRKRKKKKKKKKTTTSNTDPDEEDEKPKKRLHPLKHYQSTLWLCKSYVELGLHDDAGLYLRLMEDDKKVPRRLRGEIQAIMAYSFVKQEEYGKAIEPLELAIQRTRKKNIKNRYVYVLAQLYQKQGDNENAMQNFKKVLRLKPSFEMEFHARLNMAKNAYGLKTNMNPEMALKRMLRDRKNEEYKAEIYFALAELQLRSGKIDEGIATLQKSLNQGGTNAQRAESSLLIADLYFKQEKFVKAYNYYDSTIMAMNKEDPRYSDAEYKKIILEGVALNMKEVMLQDSLLTVASWPFEKQKEWVQRVGTQQAAAPAVGKTNRKDKVNNVKSGTVRMQDNANGFKSDNRSSRNNSAARNNNAPLTTNNNSVTINSVAYAQSKFPLYSSALQKKGEREFSKRWDNRSWGDNWRLSNKVDDNETSEEEVAELEPMTEQEVKAALESAGVPLDEEAKTGTNAKLAEALFKAAAHYRDDLGRNDKAQELLQRLLDNYPDNPYHLEALYMMYKINTDKNSTAKANTYKEQILKKYPDSDIAKSITDPNFMNKKQKEALEMSKYYDETYAILRKGKIQEAYDRVLDAKMKHGKDLLMKARFSLLEAMCVGGLKGEKEYARALNAVVVSYPNTAEEKQAKAMLGVLRQGVQDSRTNKPNISAKAVFDKNKNTGHYVLLVFPPKTKVNQYKVPVTEYNKKNYNLMRLNVSSLMLDGNIPAVIVRKFRNAELAMEYIRKADKNPKFMSGVDGYTLCAIGQRNYATVIQKQLFKSYLPFYIQEYNK